MNGKQMKTLGLIGGMSWESTALYYRLINEAVREDIGGLHSAEIIMHSYDFERIKALQYAGDWGTAGELLAGTAQRLEHAGADAIVICTNTMHKVASMVEEAVAIPLIHLADCTAEAVLGAGIDRVALLGTRFTMTEDFYIKRLTNKGLEVCVPAADEIEDVNAVIYDELCQGIVAPKSRDRFCDIVERLTALGAQGVILGCTEITMLIGAADVSIPTFDTTAIHARAAVAFALSEVKE
jgi:aspartate racemase